MHLNEVVVALGSLFNVQGVEGERDDLALGHEDLPRTVEVRLIAPVAAAVDRAEGARGGVEQPAAALQLTCGLRTQLCM